MMVPPYSSREEMALVEHVKASADLDMVVWSKEETKRYYLAGGGTETEFEKRWPKMIADKKEQVTHIQDQTLCSPGTCVMYLVSGRKQ